MFLSSRHSTLISSRASGFVVTGALFEGFSFTFSPLHSIALSPLPWCRSSNSVSPHPATRDGTTHHSTAILERKEAANRLIIQETINDDNSVVSLHPATMEMLQLFREDTILIKLKAGNEDDIFARNGRWKFNNKITSFLYRRLYKEL